MNIDEAIRDYKYALTQPYEEGNSYSVHLPRKSAQLGIEALEQQTNLRQFLKYMLSVLQNQYVTTFRDEGLEDVAEDYVALDIPYDEYNNILERLQKFQLLPSETEENSKVINKEEMPIEQ